MRRMTSLATEQAPAATGFPFKAEKLTRRSAAERNVQWVFLGCPGVGKGTYASRLSRLLGVPHIATGDLVRDELASTGPLAKQVRAGTISVSPESRSARIYYVDLDFAFARLTSGTTLSF